MVSTYSRFGRCRIWGRCLRDCSNQWLETWYIWESVVVKQIRSLIVFYKLSSIKLSYIFILESYCLCLMFTTTINNATISTTMTFILRILVLRTQMVMIHICERFNIAYDWLLISLHCITWWFIWVYKLFIKIY